ncbi:MAG: tRNA (guanosine(37)-N1)-methyltransferase TrmD [Chlamydiales bacterium]
MDIEILSLFPGYFIGPFDESIIGRARRKGILNINCLQIRDFASDKHKTVDDRPYGGGPGMVLKPEPVLKAIHSVRRKQSHVVHLSCQGGLLTAEKCQKLASYSHLILLCGHYEGIDERIIEDEVDEEISIGDYVLTNGALPAIVLVDAVARFIPGVLGNAEAAFRDSFQNGMLDTPHYTRPELFNGRRVPDVLLNGDHRAIEKWRKKAALTKMAKSRPDLYLHYLASKGEQTSAEAAGQLEVSISVADLERSIRFYCDCLGFRKLTVNDRLAQLAFESGCLTLIEGVSTPHVSPLFRYVISNEKQFKKVATQLIRKMSHLHLKSGQRELQLPFSDVDGYRWMLVFPKGEEEE